MKKKKKSKDRSLNHLSSNLDAKYLRNEMFNHTSMLIIFKNTKK